MKSRQRKGTPVKNTRPNTRIRTVIPILGLIGMGISGYLVYVHYYKIRPVCLPGFECDVVLSSSYAQIWGIPISVLGLAMYVVITLLGIRLIFEKSDLNDLISLGIYTIALSGVLFTAYLYYLEIFILHAFCTWCVGSSLVILSLLAFSLINLFTSERYIKDMPRFLRIRVRRYIQW